MSVLINPVLERLVLVWILNIISWCEWNASGLKQTRISIQNVTIYASIWHFNENVFKICFSPSCDLIMEFRPFKRRITCEECSLLYPLTRISASTYTHWKIIFLETTCRRKKKNLGTKSDIWSRELLFVFEWFCKLDDIRFSSRQLTAIKLVFALYVYDILMTDN
jgi:hypothetical protein